MEEKKLNTLIKLLEDPDKRVYDEISSNLIEQGTGIIPELENAWENYDEHIQEKLENIIHTIQFQSIQDAFKTWLSWEGIDLFEGAFWVAKYQYPEIDFARLNEMVDQITRDIWLELSNKLTAIEKIRIINHFFFTKYGFSKNKTSQFSPQYSYINHVLETRKGNSIALSILYATIAHRLALPVHCVNLPSNTILAFMDNPYFDENPYHKNKDDILFYVNPINFGEVLGQQEIDYFLNQLKIEPKDSYYLPCNNIEMINQLLLNLITSYDNLGKKSKVKDLKILESYIYNKKNFNL